MQVEMDEHLKAVVEFMQKNVPAEKLLSVADALKDVARPLWGRFPQEPCMVLRLCEAKSGPSQPIASESGLAIACAGDGSGVAAVGP